MASYFDEEKKKYVVSETNDMSKKKEFAQSPTTMDYFKEAFQTNDTRAQLEAIRRRKAKGEG
jgi:hypothetical protein